MQLFTVDQANRTLPLVRKIVEDIVREHRRWQEGIVELDLLSSSALPQMADPRVVDGFQAELEGLGIQLKDRRIGLIDFPSELDGRPVLLCWQLGEPSLQFWHDLDSGFAGRQPLSPSLVG
jgi:hypothetical protein